MRSSILLLLLGAISLSVTEARSRPASIEDWDYLLLAQFWPPTSCYEYFGKEKCPEIPAEIKGFTLHGLWPSVPGPDQPFYCNDSAPFDYDKIKSMEEELLLRWRNYDIEEDKTALWSHEWTKHGTCAESLPALRGMYNYFNVTLGLHKNLDILGILVRNHLVPSYTQTYSIQDFSKAVSDEYNVKPGFFCEHKDNTYYLEQVCLCYDKTFKMIDCPNDIVERNREWHGLNGQLEKTEGCPNNPEEKIVHFLPFQRQFQVRERVMYFESEVEIVRVN